MPYLKRRWVGVAGVDALPPPPPPPPPKDPPHLITHRGDVDLGQVGIRADGVHMVVECQRHHGVREVTIDWDEISAIAKHRSPHKLFSGQTEWRLMSGGWCPLGLVCSSCGNSLSVHVTTDQAREYLRIAVREGHVSPVSSTNPLGLED